jgi:hypothetical protein
MLVKFNPTKTLPKKTITIPQAIVIACLSASISVVATALICAHVWLGWTNFAERCGASTLVHSTMTSKRYKIADVKDKDQSGLMSGTTLATQLRESKALSTSNGISNGPWPKVVWLMSFPNRCV